MKWMRLMLPLVVLSGLVLPAQAQIFNRKPRLTMQVPELIVTAKTDPDERRRAAAVEQLRESDLRAYPDITGVLIEILLNDSGPKGTVKLEAVRSLSKVRPVSQLIGQAMQQAALNDDNWRVRLQAKTAMWMMGYHGDGKGALAADPKGMTMTEPPLANDPTVKAVPGPNAPPAAAHAAGNASQGVRANADFAPSESAHRNHARFEQSPAAPEPVVQHAPAVTQCTAAPDPPAGTGNSDQGARADYAPNQSVDRDRA